MSKSAQEHITFMDLLNEVFFIRKGHGALAYISITDVMSLFDEYLESSESAYQFINQYVNSI